MHKKFLSRIVKIIGLFGCRFALFFALFLSIYSIESKPQPLQELRAVWITNVDSYVLFTDKAIADGMDYLSSIGINVIFPVVWNKGYTLYPSNIMNYHFNTPIIPQFAGRDPLDRIIVEAHRKEVIA